MRIATTFAAVFAPTLASLLLLTASTTCHPPHAGAPAPAAPCEVASSTSEATATVPIPALVPAPPEELVPGCMPAEHRARLAEIAALRPLVYANRSAPSPKIIDTSRALAELRGLLARPCLQHLAPVTKVPLEASAYTLQSRWSEILDQLAQAMTIQRRDGLPYVLLPQEIEPEMDDALRAQLAPLLCPHRNVKGSPCQRTWPYQIRTHLAFEERRRKSDPELPADACSPELSPLHIETFEAWMACVAAEAPREANYVDDLIFGSLEHGWLLLRGHRYPYADQIRLYDLATGAAYVSAGRNEYRTGCGPTFPPGHKIATGTIARDQLRELAFFLLTSPAFAEHRAWPVLAGLPSEVPRQLSFRAPSAEQLRDRLHDRFDATEWAFSDGTFRTRGTFRDLGGASHYADDLRLIAESGLTNGCAPARLPPLRELLAYSRSEATHDDASNQLAAAVEQRLATLASRTCRGAR